MLSLDDYYRRQQVVFSTVNVQQQPITLYINPDCNITADTRECRAIGEYWNDGDDLITSDNRTHANFSFFFEGDSYYLEWDVAVGANGTAGNGTNTSSDTLGQVVIYNLAANQMSTSTGWKLQVCDHDYHCDDFDSAVEAKAERDELKFENRLS